MSKRLNFLGGGNMASAIIASPGICDNYAQADICIADQAAAVQERLRDQGYTVVATPAELPAADTCFLCTKPQDLKEACGKLREGAALSEQAAYISIAAGVTTTALTDWLGTAAIVRTMPNTPLLVGQGCTFAYTALERTSAAGAITTQVFGSCGIFNWVDDENLLDAATALSGSGPAYGYLFIEAMTATAIAMGIEPRAALEAATATLAGACKMVTESTDDPAQLRAKVTSKDGTTAAALAVLEEQGFTPAIRDAMAAAERRGKELAQRQNN